MFSGSPWIIQKTIIMPQIISVSLYYCIIDTPAHLTVVVKLSSGSMFFCCGPLKLSLTPGGRMAAEAQPRPSSPVLRSPTAASTRTRSPDTAPRPAAALIRGSRGKLNFQNPLNWNESPIADWCQQRILYYSHKEEYCQCWKRRNVLQVVPSECSWYLDYLRYFLLQWILYHYFCMKTFFPC